MRPRSRQIYPPSRRPSHPGYVVQAQFITAHPLLLTLDSLRAGAVLRVAVDQVSTGILYVTFENGLNKIEPLIYMDVL